MRGFRSALTASVALTLTLTLMTASAVAAEDYGPWQAWSAGEGTTASFRARIVTNGTTATAHGYAKKTGGCTGTLCDLIYFAI